MSALRLARGATGRDFIIKFEGCYHGHGDALLVKAGSGLLTFGVPTSPGVPADLAKYTLTADYNDLASVEALFRDHAGEIAAEQRSEEHTSELQSLMRISYAVFCLKKKTPQYKPQHLT